MAGTDTRYLKRRYNRWYFNIAVPRPLRDRFLSPAGKPLTKISVALNTQSLAEARLKRWPLVSEWKQRFERTANNVVLTAGEIEAVARDCYQSTLDRLDVEAKRQKKSHHEEAKDISVAIDQFIADIYETAGLSETDQHTPNIERVIDGLNSFDMVEHEIKAVERRRGLTLDPGSQTYRLLGRALVRAVLDAMDGRLKLLRGEPSEPPATFLGVEGINPATLQPIAPMRRPRVRIRTDDGMRFSEAAALYLEETQRDKNAAVTKQTRGQAEAVYRLFQDYTDDIELGAVTRTMAADFLATVSRLHPHWGRSVQARKMSLDELLEQFGDKGEGLSNRTINRYVLVLSAVWKWARKRGHVEGENPFAEQSRKISDQRKSGWVPYSIEELNTLFNAPLFKVPTAERVRPKKHTIESAMRWIPLIALYSGMRLGEICQLQTADVRHEHKIWFFDVREDAEGQRVKTAAAIRRVPVHSVLIKCGFIDYLKGLPTGALWPALKPGGPDDKLSWYFSKRFTKVRREIGIDRPRLSFHSFRKNVATALDNAGVNRGDIAALIGHERGFTLETYSGGKGLEGLHRIAEHIEYRGLKLDHLYV